MRGPAPPPISDGGSSRGSRHGGRAAPARWRAAFVWSPLAVATALAVASSWRGAFSPGTCEGLGPSGIPVTSLPSSPTAAAAQPGEDEYAVPTPEADCPAARRNAGHPAGSFEPAVRWNDAMNRRRRSNPSTSPPLTVDALRPRSDSCRAARDDRTDPRSAARHHRHDKEKPTDVSSTLALASLMTIAAAGSLRAQTPSPAAAPQPRGRSGAPATETPRPRVAPPASETPQAAAPAAPERPARGTADQRQGRSTLTDQRGGSAPVKRTVTVLRGDGYTGVHPDAVTGDPGRCGAAQRRCVTNRCSPTEKSAWGSTCRPTGDRPPPETSSARGTVVSTSLHDQLMMISRAASSMIVAQSADPDRRAAGDGGGEGDSMLR